MSADDQSLKLVDTTSDEVVELLRRGAPLEGRRVRGRLDLSDAVWKEEVTFVNCEFAGHLDASYAHFERPVRFEKCVVRRGASFDRTRFDSDVWLRQLTLTAPIGENATAAEEAYTKLLFLNDAQFSGAVDASQLTIQKGLRLSMERATFDSDLYLVSARIAAATIEQVRFNKTVHLESATFGSEGDPTSTEDPGAVLRFERCSVAGDLSCTGLTCLGPSSWARNIVSGKVDFSNANLRAETSLEHSRCGELWMWAAHTGPLKLDGARIDGNLVLAWMNRESSPIGAPEAPAMTLDGSYVGQNAWFDSSRFGQVSAIGLKVGLQVAFVDAEFQGKFDFYEMAVEFGAFFQGTAFHESVNLARVRIGGEAYFSGAVFHRGASFNNAVIRVLNFSGIEDSQGKERPPALFGGRLEFKGLQCSFLEMADIGPVKTELPSISLTTARVESSVFISGGPLQRLSLRHASVGGELDIQGASIASELDLLGASLGTLVLGHSRLPPSVDFRGCQYRAINADDPTRLLAITNRLSRQNPFDRQPFVALATSLRSAGHEDAARTVQIQKNVFDERIARGMTRARKRTWRWLALYGYSVGRLLGWAAILTMLSAVILAGPRMFEPPPDKGGDAGLRAACAQRLGYDRAAYFALSRVLPTALPASTQCQPASRFILTERKVLGVALPSARQPLLASVSLGLVAWILVPLIVAYWTGLLRRLDA